MIRYIKYKANLISEFESKLLGLFKTGELRAIVDSVFEIEKVADAHARVESNGNIGKVLLKISPEESFA